MIRGRGRDRACVDGIVPEYELSAEPATSVPSEGPAWIDQIRAPTTSRWPGSSLTPTWAWLLDYGASDPEPR